MLILRTLLFGPGQGHQIAKYVERITGDLLQAEHGSPYPTLCLAASGNAPERT